MTILPIKVCTSKCKYGIKLKISEIIYKKYLTDVAYN